MKNLYSLVLIIFISSISLGQARRHGVATGIAPWTPSSYYYSSAVSNLYITLNPYAKNKEFANYTGSPYLESKKFEIGRITNTIENKIYQFLIRYNIFRDIIEIQKSENSFINLRKLNCFKISIYKKKFELLTYKTTKNKTKTGYLEVLLNRKKSTLYKKYTVTLTPAKKAKSSYETDHPARFNKSYSYFYKLNTEILEIPKKKKLFINIFGDKSQQIKKFIKSKKLKPTRENDLIKIFNYYNTL
ncbi:MAG: hypothetical protein R3342_03370 [Lutibacter sp.]|uniref:hypothetical protein n=1 Tax=Lutibacter sp. TaxID=1925666 RepID=UPI00299EB6A4|nr:hypothetical protein [Lutibacter sp.]MDX1828566.1 hypothetical protein [Lutibacter sp.]